MVAPGAAEPTGHAVRPAAARSGLRFAPLLLLACTVALSGCMQQQAAAPAASLAAAPAPAATPAPAEAALPPPEQLIGADRDTIADRLGKPEFLMRAQASEIWQYRAKGCVLDVYLYEDKGDMRVVYMEARDLAGVELATGTCMQAVHAIRVPWPDATTAGT
jgi:hypothetical protein